MSNAKTIELQTADGAMAVYEAVPDGQARGAVVVIQEAFGVNGHIEGIADRLAGDGYHAVAPHLFHRAGGGTAPYDDFSKVLPLYEGKQLKIIAVSSPERLKSSPEIPTLKEKGIDFVRFGWLGLCAPAGTPQSVIDLLRKHIVSIVGTEDYRSMIEKAGSVPVSSTPEALREVLTQTADEVATTIREFGMQQDQ